MMFTRESDPASTNAFRLECPPGDRSDLDQPVYAPEGRMRCGDVNGGRSRKDCSGTAKIAETPSETARERGHLAGDPRAASESKAMHVFSNVDELFGRFDHPS
jgi:hypothetical protein